MTNTTRRQTALNIRKRCTATRLGQCAGPVALPLCTSRRAESQSHRLVLLHFASLVAAVCISIFYQLQEITKLFLFPLTDSIKHTFMFAIVNMESMTLTRIVPSTYESTKNTREPLTKEISIGHPPPLFHSAITMRFTSFQHMVNRADAAACFWYVISTHVT